MKVLHCADLHLDSVMESNLDKNKAAKRRAELLLNFERMAEYAEENGISSILIAGDLFDKKRISAGAAVAVSESIKKHSGINFYYLRGNHDTSGFIERFETIPSNLRLFNDSWTCYDLSEKTRLYGAEISGRNAQNLYDSLITDVKRINIVMLHGQETIAKAGDRTEAIQIQRLKNRGIDYLALGHVHFYKEEKLDERGVYCYAGCLEARGFDECGEHGFVVLDIDEEKGTISRQFVKFAGRSAVRSYIDVTGCINSMEMVEKAKGVLKEQNIDGESLVEIVLTGELEVEGEKNIQYIKSAFEQDYFLVKIKDCTTNIINIEDYAADMSLKGEFVRTVLAKDMPTEEKMTVIRIGLAAINGEEVTL